MAWVLAVFAALVALACAAASAWRLAIAVSATSLDPKLLLDALPPREDVQAWRRMRDAIAARDLPWESALFAGLAHPSEDAREAAISEQLLELDWQTQRLSRVPRVCASIATSAGFLFASIALLRELAAPEPDTWAALTAALNSLTIGIAGTSFCVAVHLRVRRIVRERLASTDRLVERLRALATSAT
jgi:hypothetical protein